MLSVHELLPLLIRWSCFCVLAWLAGSVCAESRPEPQATAIEAVPEWAKGIVWYQVFPERFRNGLAENDPLGWGQTVMAWDHMFDQTTHEEIELRWNRQIADPTRFGQDPDRWWGGAGQAVFDRRFGGDLQGLVEMLDHIKGLGVGGIYLCPIFDARSLHKYDTGDYRHVDPSLGGTGTMRSIDRSGEDPLDAGTWAWEAGDRYFVDVVLPEIRARQMRVILDGVWNHVGTDHFAFRDVVEHGIRSKYADWFKAEFDEDGNLLRYEAWDRPNGAMPEFRQTIDGNLAPGPKKHIFEVTRRWMDPNGDGDPSDGIDGWRLDVAAEIGRAFWRDWRTHVRSINPDAYLVGEIWSDAERWFNGVAFDAQMNYPLTYAIADWLSLDRVGTSSEDFADRVRAVTAHAPDHELVQMNLIASHDTERGVSLMMNAVPRAFDQGAEPWLDQYDRGPADLEAKERLLAAFALLVALPGSPMIYNGDEWALPGADDPDNRRPMHWPGLAATPDPVDAEFRDRLASVLRLRLDPAIGEILRLGGVRITAGPTADLVRIERFLDDRRVVFEIARSGSTRLETAGSAGGQIGMPGRAPIGIWGLAESHSAP